MPRLGRGTKELIVGAMIVIASGALVGRYYEIDDPRILGAVAAAAGFATYAIVVRLWVEVKRPRFARSGPLVRLQLDLRKNATWVVKAVALVYAMLVIFHAATSGSLSLGFQMTTSDIRLATSCPTNVGTIDSFVIRSAGESNLLMLADAVTFGIYSDETFSLICERGWPEVLG